LGVEYDLWMAHKGEQPLAAGIVLRRGREVLTAPFGFSLYQGILLSATGAATPPHERYHLLPDLLGSFAVELAGHYDRLSFCLHHSLDDLRGLQWFHYDEPEKGQFVLTLSYTGVVDLMTWHDFPKYLEGIRKTRRYEYRKCLENGLVAEASKDVDLISHLYALTFQRQGITPSAEVDRLLRSIAAAALSQGFGEMLVCRTPSGEPASATLFLYDEHCAYYLIGANDPAHRSTGSGTFLVIENIRRCMERGIRSVDCCGINSPNRGDFKTSLNALPLAYFTATWQGPMGTKP